MVSQPYFGEGFHSESKMSRPKSKYLYLELIEKWEISEVLNAYKSAPEKGLNTNLMGKDVSYWASKLIQISKNGLKKRDFLNRKNINEEKFLDHLEKIVKNKQTNADAIIVKYSNSENLNDLYDQ